MIPAFLPDFPMKRAMTRWLIARLILSTGPALAGTPGSQFTSMAGFHLGAVTLAQVATELGPATLSESGDAGEYTASVCYRTPAGAIYFLSGEMGGADHDLLGIGISTLDSSRAKSCATWPSSRSLPELSIGGIHLGMSRAAFARAAQGKVLWSGELASITFDSDKLEQQGHVDVSISLQATFAAGKLVDLRSWKIESL
jgi:hypothetical protein